MTPDALRQARIIAEKTVADMADGPLKVKAFEVVFARLINDSGKAPAAEKMSGRRSDVGNKREPQAATDRIASLRDEGFFKLQRTIGVVRDELQAHGWHYPLTTLSGTLQALVKRRSLRRQRVREGKR